MFHEIYVYWIMFWAMPEWILALVFLAILTSAVMVSNRLNVVK